MTKLFKGSELARVETTSYDLGALLDTWKKDTYSRPVNKYGYNRRPKKSRAMDTAKK
jgi:hypothetical protein